MRNEWIHFQVKCGKVLTRNMLLSPVTSAGNNLLQWSLGIVLWEMCLHGVAPYANMPS